MARKHQNRHNDRRNRRRASAKRYDTRRQRTTVRSVEPRRERPDTFIRTDRRRANEAEVRRRQRARRRQLALAGLAVLLVVLIFALRHLLFPSASTGSGKKHFIFPISQVATAVNVSQAVMYYQPVVEKYADQNDIPEYTDVLLAIMQVESGGELTDVMQSSSSAELPDDSLEGEGSIRQGCSYFAQLLRKGESLGCDLDCVIQAYNFGSGFLDYAAENGGKYSAKIAEAFAQQQSGGKTIRYENPLALQENGGWRYAYGNMFYARLVKQHLNE